MGIHSAGNLSEHVDEMVCVVPPDNEVLETLFSGAGFTTLVCDSAKLGMSESLKAGVNHFNKRTDVTGFVIGLADMPLIRSSTYQTIVAELKKHKDIVLPAYQEKRGHPVGFNAKFRIELLALQGDQGAKVLLQQYKKDITLINVDDPGIHQDFDTLSTFEHYFNEHIA